MSITFQRLRNLVSTELCVAKEGMLPDTVLGRDVKCDSLDYVNLMLKVEQEFGVDITPPETVSSMASLGELCKILESKI